MLTNVNLTRRISARFLIVTAAFFVAGCGSDGNGTDPDPTPSIAISISPSSATVEQGGSTMTTGTVTATDFSGSVSFAVQGAPAGVTATVGTPSTSGTTTTAEITIDVGASVAPGMYNITVQASGSGVSTATATFALTVSAAPTYDLTLATTAVTVEQNGSGSVGINLTRTNFTGPVDLSLEGAPTGVTHTFDIDPTTGTMSNLTVNADGTAPLGDHTLTVRGTSTLADRTATLTLTIAAPSPYTLSVNPSSLTVVQGQDGQATVTITRNTFQGDVTLSLGGAPAGVTGAFNPNPATSTDATSALTLSVGAAVAAGTYNLTVDGTMVIPGADGGDAQSANALVDQQTALTLIVEEPASYSLSLSAGDLTIVQGATGVTTVTIARTNFTEAVTLALGGSPPATLTGAFNPAAPTGTTSTLTVSVGAAVAPGTYNLSVDGTATAGNETVALNVTVTVPPSFTLSMSPSAVSVAQGANTSSTINVVRTGGFAESVAFTVTGMPSGMTATPNPTSTTGTTSTLDVTVGGSVVPNTYTLTITGDATGGGQQTTSLAVTVSTSGGGNVTVDFSGCDLDDRADWVAFKDGAGAWTQVAGTNDVYDFTISSGTGGLAFAAVPTTGATDLTVEYRTQAEFTVGPLTFCTPEGTNTMTGTVAGISVGESAQITLGDGTPTQQVFVNGPITIERVESGTHDLVGYKSALLDPGTNPRMFLRRGVVVSNGGSVGTIDFGGTDSFDPATGAMTVTGVGVSETLIYNGSYFTPTGAASCHASRLYFGTTATGVGTFTAYGAPGAQQVTGDFHAITATAADPLITGVRTVTEHFTSMGARTLALGTAIPVPTITDLDPGGAYKRLQGSVTMPGEYSTFSSFGYSTSTSSHSVFIFASSGFLGGQSVTIALDDFSAVAGWSNTFAPGSADPVTWNMGGSGTTGGGACFDGGRIVSAFETGPHP